MWGENTQGQACVAKAMANDRCRNHGGMCTGPKTEVGRAKISRVEREALLRAWAKWDPRARKKYARALYQGQGDQMRRIRRAELARKQREGLV